jgi:iron-sulfur cluster repair protein YtfE (RIC family)
VERRAGGGPPNLEEYMTIDTQLSLNQPIQQHSTVLSVLNAAGVDTCCGGSLSLEEAARQAGADLVDLVVRLEMITADRAGAAVDSSRSVRSCGRVET